MPKGKEEETKREAPDSYEPIEGLPDDFDFWITAASFGFRKEYMSGEVPLLIWEGESPDVETASVIWPIGSGWEVVDGGERVTNEKRERFVKASIYSRLLVRVVKGLEVDMRSRGEATEAKVWKGLGFHLRREELPFGAGILEEKGGKTDHLMPVEFLGDRDKVVPAARVRVKGAVEAAGKAGATVTASAVEKKLALLARKLDFKAFQDKALDVKEVLESDELLDRVSDDGPDGFWSQARR